MKEYAVNGGNAFTQFSQVAFSDYGYNDRNELIESERRLGIDPENFMSEAHARTDENGETDDAPALVGIERRVRVPPRPRVRDSDKWAPDSRPGF